MKLFDLHCDTPYKCYVNQKRFDDPSLAVNKESGKEFEAWKQVFAFWISEGVENPFSEYKKMLKNFKRELDKKPSNLTPLLSVEGGSLLDWDSDRLYELKGDGISLLTLTWNGENNIAGGVKSEKGLTDFGIEVIRKMNKLKIGCDLSHLNEKSFFAAVERAQFPLATHSNPKAVFDCKRNLSDAQIKAIAEKGGISGLCFYPEFLGGETFESFYKCVFHLLDKGYEDIIAIGSDFDGAQMDECLKTTSQIPLLYWFLEEKGINIAVLEKIFYKNADNYIAKLS